MVVTHLGNGMRAERRGTGAAAWMLFGRDGEELGTFGSEREAIRAGLARPPTSLKQQTGKETSDLSLSVRTLADVERLYGIRPRRERPDPVAEARQRREWERYTHAMEEARRGSQRRAERERRAALVRSRPSPTPEPVNAPSGAEETSTMSQTEQPEIDIGFAVRRYMGLHQCDLDTALNAIKLTHPAAVRAYGQHHLTADGPRMATRHAAGRDLADLANAETGAAPFESKLRKVAHEHPALLHRYVDAPVGEGVLASTVFPGTSIRVEPVGGGDRWRVLDGEVEIASFNTEAQALAFARGRIAGGVHAHALAGPAGGDPSQPGGMIGASIRDEKNRTAAAALQRLEDAAQRLADRWAASAKGRMLGPAGSKTTMDFAAAMRFVRGQEKNSADVAAARELLLQKYGPA